MVNKKAKGKRSKTRSKLKKKLGMVTVNERLRPLADGARVQVDIRPELHGGMPPAIYQGTVGTVQKKQGNAYKVLVKKQGLQKTLIVDGIHFKERGVANK